MIKPLFVAVVWAACRIMFYDLLRFGITNPTLVFGLWLYNLIVFTNMECKPLANTKPSNLYKLNDLGRWIWIYFIAEIMAAPVAGFIAK